MSYVLLYIEQVKWLLHHFNYSHFHFSSTLLMILKFLKTQLINTLNLRLVDIWISEDCTTITDTFWWWMSVYPLNATKTILWLLLESRFESRWIVRDGSLHFLRPILCEKILWVRSTQRCKLPHWHTTEFPTYHDAKTMDCKRYVLVRLKNFHLQASWFKMVSGRW